MQASTHPSLDLTRRFLVPLPNTTGAQRHGGAPRVKRFKMVRMASPAQAASTPDRFAHLRRAYN